MRVRFGGHGGQKAQGRQFSGDGIGLFGGRGCSCYIMIPGACIMVGKVHWYGQGLMMYVTGIYAFAVRKNLQGASIGIIPE